MWGTGRSTTEGMRQCSLVWFRASVSGGNMLAPFQQENISQNVHEVQRLQQKS